MDLKPGDRVQWRSINTEPRGEVVQVHGTDALVRVDGSDKFIILTLSVNNKKADKDGGAGGSLATRNKY